MGSSELITIRDHASGLNAFICLDDETLGPAAGGIRTYHYPDEGAAIADVRKLARAMTLKCALAGLPAGGGKAVVVDHAGLDRSAAFAVLGEAIEGLGGRFRTAGDLGTRAEDLAVVGQHTQFVHLDEDRLAEAVARGLRRCVEAVASIRGRGIDELSVAVQGCGAIGAAVARSLRQSGMRVLLADLDRRRSEALAREIGAECVDPTAILTTEVDVLAPCAIGGVIDESIVPHLRAWAVCGAANNVLADASVGEHLRARGIIHVPDAIASAGAVIDGLGRSIMDVEDSSPLIDRLGVTAREVLARAEALQLTPSVVAEARALALLRSSRSGD